MKASSRILGASMGFVLAVGLTAGTAFAAAPVVDTTVSGRSSFDTGSMESLGTCIGLSIGSLKGDGSQISSGNASGKTAGLTNVEQAIKSSSKGVARKAADKDAFGLGVSRVGTCTINDRAISATDVVTGTGTSVGSGTHTLDAVKFGTTLASPKTDCLTVANGDTQVSQDAERPLAGKIGWTFANGSTIQGFIRVQGFDSDGPGVGGYADEVWLTGIVTKGIGVGLSIGGSAWFAPVQKQKLATGYAFDATGSSAPSQWDASQNESAPGTFLTQNFPGDVNGLGGTILAEGSVVPGISFGPVLAGIIAKGCQVAPSNVPGNPGNMLDGTSDLGPGTSSGLGISDIALGAGLSDPLLQDGSDTDAASAVPSGACTATATCQGTAHVSRGVRLLG